MTLACVPSQINRPGSSGLTCAGLRGETMACVSLSHSIRPAAAFDGVRLIQSGLSARAGRKVGACQLPGWPRFCESYRGEGDDVRVDRRVDELVFGGQVGHVEVAGLEEPDSPLPALR